MAVRGERFHINLSSDDEDDNVHGCPSLASPSLDFVGDVRERAPSAAPLPPAPLRLSSASTGFPEHRKRSRISAFKQQRADRDSAAYKQPPPRRASTTPGASLASSTTAEKNSIGEENKRRLAAMSPAEIERERGELISALPQSLIERLLRRANIDEDHQQEGIRPATSKENKDGSCTPKQQPEQSGGTSTSAQPTKPINSVSFDVPSSSPPPTTENQSSQQATTTEDLPPHHPPSELYSASAFPTGPIHFPRPPPRQSPMPNLDPSSPSFFEDLQTHYFPDTPHDPSLLSWFQPDSYSSATDYGPYPPASPYHPDSSATSVSPASLRFSLAGNILAPRTSLAIPTTLGLHHHAHDPEAAGYTISELAILSRSSFPAQRCLAWQVLGRLLYRLGQGEFGEEGSTLVEGLWSAVEREGVVAGMLAEAAAGGGGGGGGGGGPNAAGRIGKHASAKAWATEAVWLWRRGGGGERGLTREGALRSK
ncbi:uncharacterized protein PADG_05986 [Paracoccidioides brasiliensis Pb18]|uniref:Transcription factor Rba50 n=1 Tax=Paracoccidioides brasiliensis (strain Pb18) TaxID=502780 RepID=C1GFF0_PARBD|nr:uncharacterized protein PADG_05986 [Paracoccidioides brasiliensis Pb18]EEH49907.1 hypothetical protein PADG_05986 [Paracoccidioides brasiliensis Pb18]